MADRPDGPGDGRGIRDGVKEELGVVDKGEVGMAGKDFWDGGLEDRTGRRIELDFEEDGGLEEEEALDEEGGGRVDAEDGTCLEESFGGSW